ncbi:MAG: glycosyltransferase [Candidatus Brocadia sp. AMX2]|uniref:Glycosyltransferase n=1 Tax=Candidatus Brocadia sinica JPN1 TaxID=1197129 RepID=A0ABQ0JWK1_9BACT|nr:MULTISPECIES: glycosyltransferase [Brocadia]KXK29607.1 MAG: family 2 glycosyltransferase SpsQ [Candidatus Brocadia sinica]MBC6931161.1 glycosyltransferase [Candidatus Brocadia sp.]MBL1167439.1 glycosyltransferase [Candidatus Brocadia sp. AMX1]NOG41088.1 glycosyltransferase [Planctomycetota bacterium]MCE7865836.1 glycosyltransferase [Candidatus Brocadia sp. AMX2]
MYKPIKVTDIELSRPLADIEGMDGYGSLQALVRLHGTPIGYIKIPVSDGKCTVAAISKSIQRKHGHAIIRHLLYDGLMTLPRPGGLRTGDLSDIPHPVYNEPPPLVTVAVCTRDRVADLAQCLDSLSRIDYQKLDVLVVDNAPNSTATEQLVRTSYPNMRYVREPRPGLDWARNRAIIESRGEIIAYTDDDVVVDSGWIKAIAAVFAENAEVMAVTGLVVPYELETEAQLLFEQCGGFGRGFERKWCRVNIERGERAASLHGITGKYGTGANMAYRRCLFDRIGYFDPALDVGTVTNGGGDLEMFFRVLKAGYSLVYEPGAIVRHCHRRDYAHLKTQLSTWGTAFYAYLTRSILAYPDERIAFFRLGFRWLLRQMRSLLISSVYPSYFPRDILLARLKGSFRGLYCYKKARRTAEKITHRFGPLTQAALPEKIISRKVTLKNPHAVAVRTVDISQPLRALTDVTDYASVRVFVVRDGNLLGSVDIANRHQSVSVTRLCEAIVDCFNLKLLELYHNPDANSMQAGVLSALTRHSVPTNEGMACETVRLPLDITVSVVIATLDRPDDLRRCLNCLVSQETSRQAEIIVVDRNPSSGLTAPVVAEFSAVMLINEPFGGLACARNKGFMMSKGKIVITINDDVAMPPDWLEKLVAPFGRSDVMVVTGNILPAELETRSQRFFDIHEEFRYGFEPLEADGDWLKSFWRRAVPIGKLGATTNAALRASIFRNPGIGLMDETLGPGTPSGGGEDVYLFYKVLKAGYTLVYEPDAYVWSRYYPNMPSLRHHLYNYGKGQVAYHLATLIFDGDLRALLRLLLELPITHLRRIIHRFYGRNIYPLPLLIIEIIGNLTGPFAFWLSLRRAGREGHRRLYIPANQESIAIPEQMPDKANTLRCF